jgi:hypothetical protein
MRTIAADIDILADAPNTGARLLNLDFLGASLLDTLRAWYIGAVGKAQLARLSGHLLSDAFGEQAARRAESHVRDGFGRMVY